MDTRNILNDENIFQFKELEYVEGAQTIVGIEEITEDTFLQGESIANALIEAGKNALAPMSEASNMLEIYEASDTVESAFNFIIPLYENMPEEIS